MSGNRATKRQQELLQYVASFITEHGYGPSYREIMRAIGYRSVSTVAVHIDGLIAKGYLRRTDNSPRSLEVITLQPTHAQPVASSVSRPWREELRHYVDQQDLTDQQAQIVNDALTILRLTDKQPKEQSDA